MNIDDVNQKLESLNIVINKNNSSFVKNITNIGNPVDIEGLYKLTTITYKNNNYMIWDMPLKGLIMPIVLNNAGINYFLLVGQSRFTFGGKVSLEVNRGFITDTLIEENLYWESLLTRKVPYLLDYVDIVKVGYLGSFMQHPDISNNKNYIQVLFTKNKYDMDIAELKKVLRSRHDYLNEPKYGPPLHNTEPVIKSFDEVNLRLNEIIFNPEKSKQEFYLNEVFSIVALARVQEYIKLNGLPF